MAAAVPAAGLDAAHRHAQLRAGGDEHGHVEGAVLLRAEDLLALVEQDGRVGRVEDDEVVDRRAALELLDEQRRARRPWANDDVLERGRRAEQREDGERAVDVGFAERAAARTDGRAGRARVWTVGSSGLLSLLRESRSTRGDLTASPA